MQGIHNIPDELMGHTYGCGNGHMLGTNQGMQSLWFQHGQNYSSFETPRV